MPRAWVDTKIALMTFWTLTRNYLGSAEASADLAQVEAKRATIAMPEAPLAKQRATERGVQSGPTAPLAAEILERSAFEPSSLVRGPRSDFGP